MNVPVYEVLQLNYGELYRNDRSVMWVRSEMLRIIKFLMQNKFGYSML